MRVHAAAAAAVMVLALTAALTQGALLRRQPPSLSTDFYDICDQVRLLGAPCEHHTITTADGFELLAIRIPSTAPTTSYPVVLQHGLVDSAVTWVANAHAYQNLGTMLHADNSGRTYDVWMPNSRGNHYSMANKNYPTEDSRDTAYWQSIDMDLMAKYDLPAVIDYVLNATGRTTLTWVGHSQGTWQAFSAFSTVHPSYADKVDLFVALAPVAYVGHSTSLLLRIIADLDAGQIIEFLGFKEFLVNDWLLRQISKVCPDVGHLCQDALDLVFGHGNPANRNDTQYAQILRYDPGGTSVNNMLHWVQELKRDTYAMHDYGRATNEQKYHQATAPSYHLSQMTKPPTALFAGTSDALADPQDVEVLVSQVPPAAIVNATYVDGYNHMDFVWGLDAHTRVYPKIMQLIAQYKRGV
uniref:Lipase n=1 Tax=Neobodo designis TaxID=312471 RepID=A0A7S1QCE9_NEODS|mmetsp:Transcript_41168/g.127130  ORF Transcript_41168/g.127130 Transcript_41168/m.127130 type:complete len:412 (+) Transcript_41168:89-1324(+)|eukprot:CAMPEP_0174851610 /NCGR_PEP_ID=MMETSP1114-20130205/23281_1 /TAXON_ID=312471 /ORGANISM="Neobodo designis, Strain CCAP 1951/1" /LENGTH=411 /DNA_ID=CAMNT_0016086157 /DNA_START=87 /DNA_END=1322 /DNA_ORIENTATION=-